eukprot:10034600-Prorocentrum_lima.AAC.1
MCKQGHPRFHQPEQEGYHSKLEMALKLGSALEPRVVMMVLTAVTEKRLSTKMQFSRERGMTGLPNTPRGTLK